MEKRSGGGDRFKNPALKQLTDQQVRFAPPARPGAVGTRRELLAEIEPVWALSVSVRLLPDHRFRPEAYPDLLIPARTWPTICARMIEALAAGPGRRGQEPAVLTPEELSKRLNVSTKTIRRWRKGPGGRRVFCNGKQQVASSVGDRSFLATNQERVQRGQPILADDGKRSEEEILRRAGRLRGPAAAR